MASVHLGLSSLRLVVRIYHGHVFLSLVYEGNGTIVVKLKKNESSADSFMH